jgi:chlorobactene glucosyltransferase
VLEPLTLYAVLILSVLAALLGIVAVNLRVLPRITYYAPIAGEDAPSVVVLVPARDEEANLRDCLPSILRQNYSNYEVWVYDDGSTDGTALVLEQLAVEHPHLRVVTAEHEPPTGWLGKAHACHRLYEAASAERAPDYVLFTDADVLFNPLAVAHAVAAARALDVGLLSVFPRQVTGSWAERLAVPLFLHWAVYSFLPLPLAFTMRTGPAFAAANGQFMLFKREAYEKCVGHEGVRAEILEDVALARAVKKAGYRAWLADGSYLVVTRMYEGAREVWRGYSKNAYAFFGYSPFFGLLGILVLLILYVTPVPLALYGLLTANKTIIAVALAQYILVVLPRLLLARRFGYPAADALLHPVGVIYMVSILANSIVWAHTGRGAWKGRSPVVRD